MYYNWLFQQFKSFFNVFNVFISKENALLNIFIASVNVWNNHGRNVTTALHVNSDRR